MLKYHLLEAAPGSFIFQIEEQGDRLNNYLKANGNVYEANNGWRVAISGEPQINTVKKIIYLRGSDTAEDLRIDRHYGYGSKEVKEIFKNVNNALREAVEAAKNWKQRYGFTTAKVVMINPGMFEVPYVGIAQMFPGAIFLR